MIEQVSFREKIIELRKEFINDRYNDKRTSDFWYVMDSLTDEEVIRWAERAIKIKDNFCDESWDADEWHRACNIIHYYRNYDPMVEMPWTNAQKRFLSFQIIKFWDDLELRYFC
jgi:hypothetical protein